MLLIAILVTAIFAFGGLEQLLKGKTSQSWPEVEGKILESRVIETERRQSGMPQKMYQVHVTYEYIVDGQRLTSDKVSFTMDEISRSRMEMTDIANELPIGKTVPVYFNPNNPTEAYLEMLSGLSPLFACGHRLPDPS